MATLSSRKSPPVPGLSQDALVKSVKPTINVLNLLTDLMKLPDDSMVTLMRATAIVNDVLVAMELEDFWLSPLPSVRGVLVYEISVQPTTAPDIVTFRIAFDIV
jgi:hypothetical protein